MPEVTCRNVNRAFSLLVRALHEGSFATVRSKSRVGDVIQITHPVTITYLNPLERVLFNRARDANPFFHVMEALWMLCGRNDVAPLVYYASDYGNITSDDGVTANGAYGYRWRHSNTGTIRGEDGGACSFHGVEAYTPNERQEVRLKNCYQEDQLKVIIAHLKNKGESRRAVLEMWNVKDDLMKVDETKDVCCNLSATFQMMEGKLDMTVFNRSNDLIWGSLGANVVHFSFLQEYVAAHLGVPVGVYNQISTNLHTYTDGRWKPEEYLTDYTPDYYGYKGLTLVPLVKSPTTFDEELPEFFEYWVGKDLTERLFNKVYSEPFFQGVALPMAKAFHWHKLRNYEQAMKEVHHIVADDWKIACDHWIKKRQLAWEKKQDELATNSDGSKESVCPSSS